MAYFDSPGTDARSANSTYGNLLIRGIFGGQVREKGFPPDSFNWQLHIHRH